MPPSDRIATNKALRHSIAATGTPASIHDLEHYELCRKTRLSHQYLIEMAAIQDGSIPRFTNAIGITNRNTLYKCDNKYWILLCHYLKKFIPEYEKAIKKIMNELSTIDKTELERLLEFVGISIETLQLLFNDPKNTDMLLEAIRPNVARVAELNLVKSVMGGDVEDSKWYLKHGDTPFNPTNREKKKNNETITIEVEEIEAKPQY